MTTATNSRRKVCGMVLAALVLIGARSGWAAETAVVSSPGIVAEATVSAWKPVFVGVELCKASLSTPRPLQVRGARIDLKEPTIRFMVTPANGEREGEVDARRSTEFLTEFKCQLAINASFFQGEYKPKAPLDIVGLCASKGNVYSEAENMAALLISRDRRVWFDDPPYENMAEVHHAVAGSSIILAGGQITVNPEKKDDFTAGQHPRSAAGTTRDGRYLILMTIDGRQPDYSEGTSLIETAEWLRRLGAWDGLNLDGGGSTNLVIEDTDGKPKLMNHPKSTWLRYCANHLGIQAKRLPEAQPKSKPSSTRTEEVIHGDADTLVPIQQAKKMKKKLETAEVAVKLVVKPGAGHGWRNILGDMAIIADWFDEHLADVTYDHGGITRGSRHAMNLALIFTGGEHGEGCAVILDALAERDVKGSFFVTGAFLRNRSHQAWLKRMVDEGHYLGPHSDGHLLYCSWDDRDLTLVTEHAFRSDLDRNLRDLTQFGLTRNDMRFFIPPYEWYNKQIVGWARQLDLVLINYTPGTRSHADWAPNDHRNYTPSRDLYEGILEFEANSPDGLRGFLLLMHLGAGPGRTDRMHHFVAPLIDALRKRSYRFVRVDELLPKALIR